MKTDNKKITSVKTIVTISAVTVIAFLLTALMLALPRITANKKLDSLKELLTSSELDEVIVYQHTPYETGTFEEISQVLEKKLYENEINELTKAFLTAAASSDYSGVSESYYAMTDYKIILTHGGKRSVFYVSGDSIYILDERMKTEFKCRDASLYEYLNKVKQAHLEEN